MDGTEASNRLGREKKTIRAMVEIYCRDMHAPREALCADCAELLDYAVKRLDRCPFGEQKPKCAACTVHCYKPAMRDRIRQVMRHSGPRMAIRHPLLALGHAIDGVRHKPDTRKN